MTHNALSKYHSRLIAILFMPLLLAVLSGCGIYKPFQLMDETTAVKPGSMAVIVGANNEANVRLAEYLTSDLKERSTFKVMSQEEVARRIGRYPVNIKWGEPSDTERPVWYTSEEKNKINGMQSKLGVDYLLIVWVTDLSRWVTTSSQGGTKVTYTASVLGNMVNYPKARPVAYSNFGESKGQSCFLFGGSEGKDIDALLKKSAESITDKFIAATKSERQSK